MAARRDHRNRSATGRRIDGRGGLAALVSRISERELWACAQHYVQRYAVDAPVHAAMRADELLAAGEIEGARTFIAIVRRIETLLAPAKGSLH